MIQELLCDVSYELIHSLSTTLQLQPKLHVLMKRGLTVAEEHLAQSQWLNVEAEIIITNGVKSTDDNSVSMLT